jgi:hypothetical protein
MTTLERLERGLERVNLNFVPTWDAIDCDVVAFEYLQRATGIDNFLRWSESANRCDVITAFERAIELCKKEQVK